MENNKAPYFYIKTKAYTHGVYGIKADGDNKILNITSELWLKSNDIVNTKLCSIQQFVSTEGLVFSEEYIINETLEKQKHTLCDHVINKIENEVRQMPKMMPTESDESIASLCTFFGVRENQHFYVDNGVEYMEYYISNNTLYRVNLQGTLFSKINDINNAHLTGWKRILIKEGE